MNSVAKNIVYEIAVILGIIILAFAVKSPEVLDFAKSANIFECIAAFGILWVIGSFFRLIPFPYMFVSWSIALPLMIVGIGINSFGLCTTLAVLGLYLVFAGYVLRDCFEYFAPLLSVVGMICLALTFPLKNHNRPLKPEYEPWRYPYEQTNLVANPEVASEARYRQ